MLLVETQLGLSRRRDQDLHRRLLDDPFDERLGRRRLTEVVVVVDRDPGVVRPGRQILREQVDQDVRARPPDLSSRSGARTVCRSLPGRISAPAAAIWRASTATSAEERRARTQATRRSCAAHCSASVVFPYPAPRHEHPHARLERSSARISLGRSRMRRRRSGGFGRSAISLTGEATAGRHHRKVGARGGPGTQPRAPCRQTPGRRCSSAEACRERVFPREHPERDRDLPAPAHAELRAQRVRMRLRRTRRDAEPLSDLVVRAPCRDQRDDFALPRCQARPSLDRRGDHAARG